MGMSIQTSHDYKSHNKAIGCAPKLVLSYKTLQAPRIQCPQGASYMLMIDAAITAQKYAAIKNQPKPYCHQSMRGSACLRCCARGGVPSVAEGAEVVLRCRRQLRAFLNKIISTQNAAQQANNMDGQII